jgi:hypothetical integral membrane protein (TIGR02206 family)
MTVIACTLMFVALASIPSAIAILAASDRHHELIRRLVAGGMVAVTILYNAYYLSPSNFRVAESLPLQVCDLLGIIAALALSVRWRMARAILIMSTLPFVSQAVLTPVGDQEALSLRTWLYWTFHGFIFACFLFDVIVARFRPQPSDLVKVLAFDICYVALISGLDVTFGWNYGYIGDTKPETATLIDVLGPWPFRIFSMLALAMLFQTICFLIFKGRGPHT